VANSARSSELPGATGPVIQAAAGQESSLAVTGLPYSVRKTNGAYQVVDRETGKVYSRHTTKDRAERQRRLLEGVRHGWKPTGKKSDA
jgi:hypothetical protein